jgi:hypothetical protein
MEKAMKKFLYTIPSALLVLVLAVGAEVWADSDLQGNADLTAQVNDTLFAPEELADLLAPIALYPDPLIAQILPAATFVDQIDEAERYVRQYGKSARIDDQPWDVSVKAVAHYPDVLFMMDQKYDWTASLGQAFVNQQEDVMDAIQRLRAEAVAAGNLVSTPQQQVVDDDGVISIVPAEPAMIYVPSYDPLAAYLENPYPSYGLITFGIGLTIGAWLNSDCDWHGHRVYHHGWRDGGWTGRARPHIRDRRNIYKSSPNAPVTINRRVMQRDTARFRQGVRSNVQLRWEQAVQPTTGERSGGGIEKRDVSPRPVTTAPPTAVRPSNRDLYQGRALRNGQTAPPSGFGGYGSGKDAKTYRERGQSSRENIPQPSQPPQVQRPAPQQRPAQSQRPAGGAGRESAPWPARGGAGERR